MRVGRQLQGLFESLADGHLHRLVGRVLGPQAHAVLRLAHRHDDAADVTPLLELLPNERQQRVQPERVQCLLVALGHRCAPLTAGRALRVLPLGLDTLLEAMEISAGNEAARLNNVVVQAARPRVRCVTERRRASRAGVVGVATARQSRARGTSARCNACKARAASNVGKGGSAQRHASQRHVCALVLVERRFAQSLTCTRRGV